MRAQAAEACSCVERRNVRSGGFSFSKTTMRILCTQPADLTAQIHCHTVKQNSERLRVNFEYCGS